MCEFVRIFIAGPSTIHIARQTELCCRTLWQSFERSCSLDDFEASTIENAAAVSNLDNIAMCFCCGHCLQERETTFVSARAMKGISGNT